MYGKSPTVGDLDSLQFAFTLKTPWEAGTTHRVFAPLEFQGHLATLAWSSRLNLIRYHGVIGRQAPIQLPCEHECSRCRTAGLRCPVE